MRLAVLMASGSLLAAGPSAAYSDEPGESAGKKIGTIVKTAIQTALPGAAELVNLFWPKDKQEGDKIKKDELRKQIEQAQKQAQNKVTAAAQSKLIPVSAAASELELLNRFLRPAVDAQQFVGKIQARLHPAPSDDAWQTIKKDWDAASKLLNGLKEIKDDQINTIEDKWLRNTLIKIRDANRDVVDSVDAAVGGKDVVGLAIKLADLSTRLNDVVSAVGYELFDLRTGLTELSKWAKGEAGPGRDGPPNNYKELLQRRYP